MYKINSLYTSKINNLDEYIDNIFYVNDIDLIFKTLIKTFNKKYNLQGEYTLYIDLENMTSNEIFNYKIKKFLLSTPIIKDGKEYLYSYGIYKYEK